MTNDVKILLVEDDRIDQMAFERMIKKNKLPYDYKMVSSVFEAEHMLSQEQFNMVITDYILGDGTGNDILDHIKNIPVIFTTGAGDEEIAVKAMRSGAYDYLIKDPDRNYLKVLPLTISRAINDKRSSERLRLLESVVVNGNDAVLITDVADISKNYPKILYTNQAFSAVTGYSDEELQGKSTQLLFGQQTSRRELVKIRQALRAFKPVRSELQCYKKDGSIYWNDMNLVPVEDERGTYTHWISVHRDITDRKNTQEALLKAKILAEDSMKSKEQFLANMSHEIRTPMNAVIGMTNLLLNTDLNSEQEEYLEIIKQSSESLLVIINDILDFSKIESGKITFESTSFSLKNLIQKVISILNIKAVQKGLSLTYFISDACPNMIMGDSVRLDQILINLVGNAIKFTNEGRVKIRVEVEQTVDDQVMILFSVIDTGIGVSPDKLETIFESFSQAGNDTTRKFGGTGLGLAITKQLVELQGGKIWVNSQLGNGSRFNFLLPFKLSKSSQEPVAAKPKQKTSKKFYGRHVLLVEDNHFNQIVAKKTLSMFQVKCDVAENGRIALEKLHENSYDLILMDIQMPEMDGYEASKQIRKLSEPVSNIPIIAMTASALKGDEQKCLQAGMNDYISKPFDPDHLFDLLAKHFPKKQQPEFSLHNVQDSQSQSKPKLSLEEELQQSGIDLAYLNSLSGGSTDFVIEMIQLFLTQSPEFTEKLHREVQEQKWEDLSKTAHKFLSSVSYMGIKEVAKMLKQVENDAKSRQNLNQLPSSVAEIIEKIHVMENQLKRVFLDHKIAV